MRPQTGARQKILDVSSNTGKKGVPKTFTLQFSRMETLPLGDSCKRNICWMFLKTKCFDLAQWYIVKHFYGHSCCNGHARKCLLSIFSVSHD